MAGVSAGTAYINVFPNMSGFNKALAAGMNKLGGKTISAAGSSLTKKLTLPILAVGAVATKMALDFEDAMTNIEALVGVGAKQMAFYREEVLKLAKETPQGPQELAEALYFVTSSGFEGAEALEVLKASAMASAAGLGSTVLVADAVTSAVNAYAESGLTAADSTDILTAAIREGKSEPEEFAQSIGRVIGPAQAMGVEFHEVAGVMASLSLVGLDASESTTALRGSLMGILKPTEQTRKFLKKTGESIADIRTELADKGLLETFTRLAKKYKGNQDALGKLFPNVRALNGFLLLTGDNAKKTEDAMEGVRKSTGDAAVGIAGGLARAESASGTNIRQSVGDTKAAFDKAMRSKGNQMRKALANIKVILIELGEKVLPLVAEWLLKLTDYAKRLSKWFNGLSESQQDSIKKLIVVAIVAGPLLSVLGTILSMVGVIIALGATGAIILGVIGLIVLLGVAFVIAYKKSEKFKAVVDAVFGFIKRHWQLLFLFMGGFVVVFFLTIVRNFGKIRDFVSNVFNTIKQKGSAAWQWIINKGNAFVGWFRDLPGRISNIAGGMFDSVKDAARSALNWVIGAFNGLSIPGFSVDPLGKFGPIINVGSIDLIPVNIPMLASGGTLGPGQLGIVGERGAEWAIGGRGGTTIAPIGGGTSMRLTITNWDEGTGYIEAVADGAAMNHQAHGRQLGRIRRG